MQRKQYSEEQIIRDSFAKGPKVVTFARVLKHKLLPLPELLQDLLEMGYRGMCCDIEIEFAVDLDENKGKNIFPTNSQTGYRFRQLWRRYIQQ